MHSPRNIPLPAPLAGFFCVLAVLLLTACAANPAVDATLYPLPPEESTSEVACPLSIPELVKPPEDTAVQGEPGFSYYFVNEDHSLWASAWWFGADGFTLQAGDDGNKVGWFRPAGVDLEISGQRLDGEAPPLEAHVPCCYPTRFQATGLSFPTAGCWEVNARAADQMLTFVVWVEQ